MTTQKVVALLVFFLLAVLSGYISYQLVLVNYSTTAFWVMMVGITAAVANLNWSLNNVK